MPHIVLEYSADLEGVLDVPALLARLHRDLGARDEFELDRIKSRAIRTAAHRVGDAADAGPALLHATVLFAVGRPPETRRAVGQAALAALRAAADAARAAGTGAPGEISCTVEVREFAKEMYFRE